MALPMDWVGLSNSRLDVRTRWTDSSVTDPVTGESRRLSGIGGIGGPFLYREEDVKLSSEVKFRQDFEVQKVGWGWDLRSRTKRVLFKIDELDTINEEFDVGAFIETTRWFGIKMSLSGRFYSMTVSGSGTSMKPSAACQLLNRQRYIVWVW